jgi:hypothetical protein
MADVPIKQATKIHSIKEYKQSIKGTCLCGQVTYEIRGNMGVFQYCHCSRGQKFTGSAHASNLFVKPDDFSWFTGIDRVGRYSPPRPNILQQLFVKSAAARYRGIVKVAMSLLFLPVRLMQILICDLNGMCFVTLRRLGILTPMTSLSINNYLLASNQLKNKSKAQWKSCTI